MSREQMIEKIVLNEGFKKSDAEFPEALKDATDYYNQNKEAGYSGEPLTDEEIADALEDLAE